MKFREYLDHLSQQIHNFKIMEAPVLIGDDKELLLSNVEVHTHSIKRISDELDLMFEIQSTLRKVLFHHHTRFGALFPKLDEPLFNKIHHDYNLAMEKNSNRIQQLIAKALIIQDNLNDKLKIYKISPDEIKKSEIIEFIESGKNIIKIIKHHRKIHKDLFFRKPSFFNYLLSTIKSILLVMIMPLSAKRRIDTMYNLRHLVAQIDSFFKWSNLFKLVILAGASYASVLFVAQSTVIASLIARPMFRVLQPAINTIKSTNVVTKLLITMQGLYLAVCALNKLPSFSEMNKKIKETAKASVDLDTYLTPLPKLLKTKARNEFEDIKSFEEEIINLEMNLRINRYNF